MKYFKTTDKRTPEMSHKKLFYAVWRMVMWASPEELAELTVNEIAKQLDTSPSNLCHAFNKHCYYTLGRFLELKKFLTFESLIRNNKVQTVKEALEILDIWSTSHFIKRYKEYRGFTPGETIKKHKKEEAERKQKQSQK
jgi:AraC-like DNA-binding protein